MYSKELWLPWLESKIPRCITSCRWALPSLRSTWRVWHFISSKQIGLKLLHSTPLAPPITILDSNGSSAPAGRSPRRWRISDMFSASSQGSISRRVPTAEVNDKKKIGEERLTVELYNQVHGNHPVKLSVMTSCTGFAHEKKPTTSRKNSTSGWIGILRRQNATGRCMYTTRKETKFQCQDDPCWHAG